MFECFDIYSYTYFTVIIKKLFIIGEHDYYLEYCFLSQIILFPVTSHAGVFLFVMTDDVNQSQIVSGEQQLVEIVKV